MLIERKLKKSNFIFNFWAIFGVISRYIKIRYEKYQNTTFLTLI